MEIPNEKQIEETAVKLGETLGNGVHLKVTDVALSVDSQYPGMTDEQFKAMRDRCVPIVERLRSDALHKMWAR